MSSGKKISKKHTLNSEGSKRAWLSTSALKWWCITIVLLIGVVAYVAYRSFVNSYFLMLMAKYGAVEYPLGEVRGIDVSRYQEEIDWDSLKVTKIQGAPVSFVFVKATEGGDLVDKYFEYNFYCARMNNIIRGAYHFYSTMSDAREQANLFCRTVQLREGDLPPVLDVEVIGGLTKECLQKELAVWLDIVEDYYGVTPIIYTSHSFYKENLDTPLFESYPRWIAHYYIDSLSFDGDWHFWQHTDYGKVNGIEGYVDVNLFNGTYAELQDMTIKPE